MSCSQKLSLFVACTGLLLCADAWSEVVFLKDGTVYIGQIVYAANGKVGYQIGNRTIDINSVDIESTELKLESLQNRTLKIELKDSSVLVGRITDYDADLGLGLQMDIGPIVVPMAEISRIYSPELANRYAGESQSVLMQFYFAGATVKLQPYGAWLGPRLSTLFKLPLLRGLYIGPTVGLSLPTATPVADTGSAIGEVLLTAEYQFHFLDNEPAPWSWFVPYCQLSAGAAITAVWPKTAASVPGDSASLSGCVNIELGSEINPLSWLTCRLSFITDIVMYAPTPEVFLGANLSLGVKW